jgi:type VI secretion system secreted protein VgrG
MARFCELSGPLGDSLQFARMSVSEGLSRLFEIELVALSTRGDIAGKDLLGHPMTVTVNFGDKEGRYYNGYVTRFAYGGIEGRYHSYRMTLRPWLWFLTRQSDCMVFQAKKIPDIVKEVFEREATKALDDAASNLSGSYAPWEYCVQYRETDFNFVSRLMEQEGIYYFFEHTEKEHKLVLVDGKDAHKPVEGEDEIAFVPGGVDNVRLPDWIAQWDVSEQIEPGRYVLNDYNYERPNLKLEAVRKPELPVEHARGSSEMYDYPGEYDTVNEGEFYVGHRIEELAAQASTVQGAGTLRMFQSGRTFTLAKHPRKDQNAKYLITSTQYEYEAPGLESGGDRGARFTCSFTAIRAQQQFRPPRVTLRPVVQGVQTAFVTGPSGSEIHTDELGRVRVQFHWDRVGKNDEKSSCWLRVASIAAGPRFGFVSIPRMGQEVVVSFLEGDPDRPLITGVVYNGLNKPPWELPAKKNISGFLTRSTTGGAPEQANELHFDDTKGSEKLRIHAQRDYEMRTENNLIDWIGGKSEHFVKLDHLEKVEGKRNRTVASDELIKVDGARSAEIKGDEARKVGGGHHLEVTGDDRRKVGGGFSLKVATDVQVKSGTKFAVDAGTEVHLKAGTMMTLEAGTMLTLKVGGNFVNINSAGVFIQGTMVMINSGGSAGSGSGASPMAPKAPTAPEVPGEPPKPETAQIERIQPKTYSPRAVALKAAAQKGAPFCEICNC